jgi:DNA-binding response OmpR family regulator
MKRPAKILIVDDEPDILLLLRIDLEAEGFETLLAADGETAIKRITEERPDMVLLDVMMPVVDGWGVLKHLAEKSIATRVVTLSAKASGADVSRALELGAVEYVTKPFDPAALLLTVNHVLSSSAGHCRVGGRFGVLGHPRRRRGVGARPAPLGAGGRGRVEPGRGRTPRIGCGRRVGPRRPRRPAGGGS